MRYNIFIKIDVNVFEGNIKYVVEKMNIGEKTMGNIEFLGIIDENYSLGEVIVPDNANVVLEKVDSFNPLYEILFCLPIILLILIPTIIKHRKYGILNKEVQNEMKEKVGLKTTKEKVKFFLKNYIKIFIIYLLIFFFIMLPLHEYMHAFVGAIFGANMKVGIIPEMAIAVTMTSSPLTKLQFVLFLITPMIIMGIFPAIIILLNYPKKIKNHFLAWFLTFLCLGSILSASADLISTYNICKSVPNGAIIQSTDENTYWYMPHKY